MQTPGMMPEGASGAPEIAGGSEGWAKFAEQLTENASKTPGWAYLLLLSYGSVWWMTHTRHVRVSVGLIATVCTYSFYQLGDALDKGVFKKEGDRPERYWPDRYERAFEAARKKLGVCKGSYQISIEIIRRTAPGRHLRIQLMNELIKAFRGALFPSVVPLIYLLRGASLFYLVPAAVAWLGIGWLLIVYVYPQWKAAHIAQVYRQVSADLEKQAKLQPPEFPKLYLQDVGEVRLFLWDGLLIGAAKRGTNLSVWRRSKHLLSGR